MQKYTHFSFNSTPHNIILTFAPHPLKKKKYKKDWSVSKYLFGQTDRRTQKIIYWMLISIGNLYNKTSICLDISGLLHTNGQTDISKYRVALLPKIAKSKSDWEIVCLTRLVSRTRHSQVKPLSNNLASIRTSKHKKGFFLLSQG